MICRKYIDKYKEIILYVIFGGLTTAVNFIVYFLFTYVLKVDYFISNIIAWVISVVFAYWTNKKYVFVKTDYKLKTIIKEIIKFFSCRLFSGAIDIGGLYIFVDILDVNDIIAKVIIGVIVVVINYVFSKLFIFINN